MKNIDNIEDWYRDELNNYSVEPDKSVWDSLSKDLDASTPLTEENVSEWYKKEVAKFEERPDYTVWEKLSTKLDTATVWDKLVVSLNRYDQFIWWRNLAFRGTAVFLLFFGSYLAYDNYTDDGNNTIANNTNTNSAIQTTNNNDGSATLNKGGDNNITSAATNGLFNNGNKNRNEKLANSSKSKSTSSNKVLSPEEKIKKAVSEAKTNLSAKSSTSSANRIKEDNTYASKENITTYNSISVENLSSLKTEEEERTIFTDINRHQLSERDISHLYSSGDFLVKKDKNKIVFNSKRFSSYTMFGLYARRIYVGFNAGFKKQGMITKLKDNSPLADYKQNNFLDFGTNFGGTVGFIISDNFNMEANINVNSTSGYKRAFDAEGISFQENLNLNYTSISLLAKKMNNKSTFDNKVYSTNLIGGVYASYLRSAVSDINGVSQNLDEYNKADFGIVLGIEQDRYITKTLVITPGLRYNQGLTNNVNDNSPFESSRNFSFEFNLGVKYIFLKKAK